MQSSEQIERLNQKRYEEDYSLEQISLIDDGDPSDFFKRLVAIKLSLVERYGQGKTVLDLGCGAGDYLFRTNDRLAAGYGLDFSAPAIKAAQAKAEHQKTERLKFIQARARRLPFANGSFDVVYSFSALFYMPQVGDVIAEAVRVTKPGGILIFELGNHWSLNTIVCAAHPELAQACHIPVGTMKKLIAKAHLDICEWRSFQLLPYWGNRPTWLRPCLHPVWKRLMQKLNRERMWDEHISSLPCVRRMAFRHLFVCHKPERSI